MSSIYRFGVLSYQIIGGVCALFFIGCSIGAYLSKQYPPIAVFAFFVVLGLYMVLAAGKYELGDLTVHHRTLFGHFRMGWSEIERVEVGTQGSLILHGKGKRFALPPAAYWSGTEKPYAYKLLKQKLDTIAVPTYPSNIGDYKIHKNVRVRSGAA